jgi:hypothetical protein
MSELLSYSNILNDINNFRRSGSASGADFNIYDTPAHKYFRLLFYFGSNPEFGDGFGSGFLAPTWDNMVGEQYYNYNSAWAYLKLNDENERAEKLEQFITLLSDINTNSPWYFSTLGGIDSALERKGPEDGVIEIADKKLTINCLPDAFDNRIGTLLELYRDITWSWVQKKEIVPANLRKFDMAVYIFETAENNWHLTKGGLFPKDTIIAGSDDAGFKPSYKMLEFHNCEFNYNSIKTGWSELNNQTGVSPTYQIEITFADCYEISYNDIMMRTIGDVITTDMINSATGDNAYISVAQQDSTIQAEEIKSRTYPYDKGWANKVLGQVGGHLVSDITNWAQQKLMGNIYGFSLTGLRDGVQGFMQGDLIKTGMTLAQFVKEQKNKNVKTGKADGNIYEAPTEPTKSSKLGNIFSGNTLANNL